MLTETDYPAWSRPGRPGQMMVAPATCWSWIGYRCEAATELFHWDRGSAPVLHDDAINAVYWLGACLPAGAITPWHIRRIVRMLIHKRRNGESTHPPRSIACLLPLPAACMPA